MSNINQRNDISPPQFDIQSKSHNPNDIVNDTGSNEINNESCDVGTTSAQLSPQRSNTSTAHHDATMASSSEQPQEQPIIQEVEAVSQQPVQQQHVSPPQHQQQQRRLFLDDIFDEIFSADPSITQQQHHQQQQPSSTTTTTTQDQQHREQSVQSTLVIPDDSNASVTTTATAATTDDDAITTTTATVVSDDDDNNSQYDATQGNNNNNDNNDDSYNDHDNDDDGQAFVQLPPPPIVIYDHNNSGLGLSAIINNATDNHANKRQLPPLPPVSATTTTTATPQPTATTTTTTTTTNQGPADKRSYNQSKSRTLILSQYRELVKAPPPGISVDIDQSNIHKWKVVMIGPPGTPYEGGIFPCSLVFPAEYPSKPPVFSFLTSNFVHPNVFPDGKVCISILHDPSEPYHQHEPISEKWRPVLGVEQVLLSVMSLLTEPNCSSPANQEFSSLYKNDPAAYRKKVIMMVRRTQEES